jgi:tetratricopeptide (TPR) repeat protein
MIKNFALRRFIVFNRIPIAVVLIALGLLLGFTVTWWIAWIPMLIAIIMVIAHFMVGPMTLLQTYMEAGDMEGAQDMLKRVKKPEWLYKPLRSSYFMLRGQLSAATSSDDNLDQAEADFKKSLASGMTEKGAEGTAYLQLGSIAAKKGNMKEAYEHLRQAVKLGLPDKDSEAMAFLQLTNLSVNRRDYRGAKMYFNRAKNCKANNPQVVEQIKEMAKYMARIPG